MAHIVHLLVDGPTRQDLIMKVANVLTPAGHSIVPDAQVSFLQDTRHLPASHSVVHAPLVSLLKATHQLPANRIVVPDALADLCHQATRLLQASRPW